MDLNLKDKIVVVTGGARGIGRGISMAFAREGAIAVIIGRTSADNLKTVAEIERSGGKAFHITAELTDPGACEKAVIKIIKQFGRIDVLVNNAGENDGVGLMNGNYQKFMDSLHKNLIHYYLMAHFCILELIKSKGCIVNIGSKTAETGQGGTSGYAAANGGRNALTREWAAELVANNVRVNAVVVAECWTPLYERWLNTVSNPKEKLDVILNKIPLGKRMTTVEEIANMVAFLASPVSAHTTGQIIHVDGGYVHLDRALT